jgi:hypothetical protein
VAARGAHDWDGALVAARGAGFRIALNQITPALGGFMTSLLTLWETLTRMQPHRSSRTYQANASDGNPTKIELNGVFLERNRGN